MINGAIPTAEQINPLNFNKMTTTKTATAEKPNLLLKGFALFIAVFAILFTIVIITGTFLNI